MKIAALHTANDTDLCSHGAPDPHIIRTVNLRHLYLSRGHNFFGHHGKPPGTHTIEEHLSVVCRAGCGLEGDRFFRHKDNYKGQITFVSAEVISAVCALLGRRICDPAVLRRNVVTEDIDLNALVGRRFRLGGVDFEGTEECRPCYWMDTAIGPGAEMALRGRGGLRARILSNGALFRGPAALVVFDEPGR